MAWDVSADDRIYTNISMPGNKAVGGRYSLQFVEMDFVVEFTGEYIDLSLEVRGGLTQECTEALGSTVSILSNASPQNGASLASIDWMVNGSSIGSTDDITPFLSVGIHDVEVTAVTTTGFVTTDSATIVIEDTTRPNLTIEFIDEFGNPVTSSGPGDVTVNFTATDICDPNPTVAPATTTPTYVVEHGDVLTITNDIENLNLPIMAISVTTRAIDVSGNLGFTTSKSLMLD